MYSPPAPVTAEPTTGSNSVPPNTRALTQMFASGVGVGTVESPTKPVNVPLDAGNATSPLIPLVVPPPATDTTVAFAKSG